MPTYSYECGSCGTIVDVFHGMSAEPKIKCESCGKVCKRLMGTGAGIIFKGTGFYETDYKDKKGVNPEKVTSEKAAANKKDAGSAPAKTAGASESKSTGDKPKSSTSSDRKKAAND